VTYVERSYPSLETAPTPRPVQPEQVSTGALSADWDFLSDNAPIPQLAPKAPAPKLQSRDPNPSR
jgi:hypothetical protein